MRLIEKLKAYSKLKNEIATEFGVGSYQNIEDNTDKYFTVMSSEVHFDEVKYDSFDDADYSEQISGRGDGVTRKDGLVLVNVRTNFGDDLFMVFDEAKEIKEE